MIAAAQGFSDRSVILKESAFYERNPSETGYQFEVHQPGCQTVGYRENGVGKIFNEQIRNGVVAVYQVEYLKRGPNVFKIA